MEQFARTEMLLGADSLNKLKNSCVMVVGLGGVGGFTAEALCRAGVKRLIFADFDTVSESNLNRQIIALHSTLGQNKAELMAARGRDINPEVEITVITERYGADNRELFFAQKLDYIVDAIDSVSDKLDLIVTALERGVPIISALGTGNKLDASKFAITDISKTTTCPLARVMRRELRSRGINHHRVLYSTEQPISVGGRTPGSVPWVPSAAGLMLAGDVVLSLISK